MLHIKLDLKNLLDLEFFNYLIHIQVLEIFNDIRITIVIDLWPMALDLLLHVLVLHHGPYYAISELAF